MEGNIAPWLLCDAYTGNLPRYLSTQVYALLGISLFLCREIARIGMSGNLFQPPYQFR